MHFIIIATTTCILFHIVRHTHNYWLHLNRHNLITPKWIIFNPEYIGYKYGQITWVYLAFNAISIYKFQLSTTCSLYIYIHIYLYYIIHHIAYINYSNYKSIIPYKVWKCTLSWVNSKLATLVHIYTHEDIEKLHCTLYIDNNHVYTCTLVFISQDIQGSRNWDKLKKYRRIYFHWQFLTHRDWFLICCIYILLLVIYIKIIIIIISYINTQYIQSHA